MEKPKKNKKNKLCIITNLLLALSALFLIYTITLISGIETEIRIIGIIAIVLIDIVIMIIIHKLAKKKKVASKIILIITFLLTFAIQILVGLFVFKTYSSIDNMNKNKITYESVIITMKDSKVSKSTLNNAKIGLVKDETSIDGYLIGLEIINENKLSKNIEYYTDSSSMISDLYNEKIDAAIVSGNYTSIFKSIEKFKDIETNTKIILTKEKTYTKKEIEKITKTDNSQTNLSTSKADTITKPFTLLIMGIDSEKEDLSKNATGNGDALMLVTFNPKTLNATILSIPRDTYVPIACFANQKENKITHAAWNGESCMIKTIENFTSIPIDYYVKINFKGVVKLVDALGGIEVDVPIEFCEQNSNRQLNTLCLKKGYQKLNGEEALALARHRKTLLTGDLQRGENQQLVIQGILNKAKTVKNATQALSILDAISNSMDTNFTTKQILSFYDIAKTIFMTSSSENPFSIQQLQLAGASQNIYDEDQNGNGIKLVLYNYIPNQDSKEKIVNAMKKNLGLKKIDKTYQQMDFNIEETYEITPIGKSGIDATKLYTLLPNFVGNSAEYAKSWLESHGINVIIEEEETSEKSGIVLSQSQHESKRVDLISSITLKVSKAKNVEVPSDPIEEEANESNESNNSEESNSDSEQNGVEEPENN